MKMYVRSFLITIMVVNTMGCDNSQDSGQSNRAGKFSNSTLTDMTDTITQKITPCLWVDSDAKGVADYYLSIFKNGKMKEYRRYENPPEAEEQGGQESFETAIIEIGDIEFSILAAGPYFKFNESVSFVITCKDQAEVDYYWDALTADGGEEGSCGWCKDKYGLSWQVVPVEYFHLIHSDDPRVREKAMRNTFKQKKLILSELR